MASRRRKIVLGALLTTLGLPLVVGGAFTVWYLAQNETSGHIRSGGQERDYLLHVPVNHDPSKPLPLVVCLHGAALWPAVQSEISQWNRVADQNGFLVVYPSGMRIAPMSLLPRLPVWLTGSEAGRTQEVRFIADLLDSLAASYRIDPARIYVSGFSNGGGMAFVLSCALRDRIAAVGLVAAAMPQSPDRCPDPRPMPMLAFHGTNDSMVSYDPVPGWVESWARRNRCASETSRSMLAPDVARMEYRDCDGGAGVVLYPILGGGHSWPGGGFLPRFLVGSTSQSIDATAEMWEFFGKHRLAQP